MLAVIDQTERQRHIELTHLKRIEIVNRLAVVFDIQPQHVAHELSLLDQIPLRVETQHARRAAAFQLDRIEAGVATNVEHRLAGKVFGDARPHTLPGRPRVIDGLANRAPGLREYAVAQIDAVKPRAEMVHLFDDFSVSHRWWSVSRVPE